jgi:hypothetical protein
VQTFGTLLHVLTIDPERTEASLEPELGRDGVRVDGLRRILPSVEDVFVALTQSDESKMAR